ncbi:integrin alpha [Meinhardsimonia xiamenensis]|uniref:integrin alpha n=1 Tax=Meinhardsimonia xiamenensis TaxID=990712 RepID=UPI00115F882D
MTVYTNYRIVGSNDFGAALTAVGDIDGDGIVDFAIGAPNWTSWGDWEGTAWLVSGGRPRRGRCRRWDG